MENAENVPNIKTVSNLLETAGNIIKKGMNEKERERERERERDR